MDRELHSRDWAGRNCSDSSNGEKFDQKTLVIEDARLGRIELRGILAEVALSREMLRLKNVGQLGCIVYLLPEARYSRWDHCVGTAHLARTFASEIARNQPELNISDQDVLCVTLAGLLHDVGHGPFSHTFDGVASQAQVHWQHEEASILLLKRILARFGNISADDTLFIEECISGYQPLRKQHSQRGTSKRFLLDLISNSLDGIDVDRIDYTIRDIPYVKSSGTPFTKEAAYRLMSHARVITTSDSLQRICFSETVASDLKSYFVSRFQCYDSFYFTETVRPIDAMMAEALSKVGAAYIGGRKSSIYDVGKDPLRILDFDDSIVEDIASSTDPELEQAKSIINDIKHEKYWKSLRSFYSEETCKAELNSRLGSVVAGNIILKEYYLQFGCEKDDPLSKTLIFTEDGIVTTADNFVRIKGPFAYFKNFVISTRPYELDKEKEERIVNAIDEFCQSNSVRFFLPSW